MDHSFSVILCAYTEARWDDLLQAIASVQRQIVPAFEIIVAIDHNPTLFARVQQALPDVIVVENREARGLSGTRNSGIAVAQGSHIVFLDDDAVAAPDWLARLQAVFASTAAIGAGGAIEPLWRGEHPAWFPAEFHWVVGCTYRGMPENRAIVRNVIGCNMAFRKDVFAAIGGFRIGRVGALSIGQENDETEFCIRLKQALPKAELWYEPAATVQHNVPPARTTLAYYARRCFSEGVSKARLARQVGQSNGLSTERAYTLQALPSGVLRGVGDTLLKRDGSGLLRAGAIIAGFAITAAGYLLGRVSPRFRAEPAATQNVPVQDSPASRARIPEQIVSSH